jgi:predicted nucleic acid-binding protein
VIVVADTSVLINLCRVGLGGLFRQLFREVVIPPEVAAEFTRLAAMTPRFAGLTLPAGIRQQSPAALLPAVRAAIGLDAGEAAALSLAVEIHADAVLVDERRGHEVAHQLGLRTIGVLGILLRAKSDGHLPAVQPVLEALQRDAGFWLSESLKKQVLGLADETA